MIGAMLCALASALIVTGLAALPVLQPYLLRLDRQPAGTASARGQNRS